jgi:protein PhnA
MSEISCPKCSGSYAYADGPFYICPECHHEWSIDEGSGTEQPSLIDAVGNTLVDGDSVTVIKDLKVKGSSKVIKVGTKAKNIRIDFEPSDDHDIFCKIDGFGAIKLKSSVVKKN